MCCARDHGLLRTVEFVSVYLVLIHLNFLSRVFCLEDLYHYPVTAVTSMKFFEWFFFIVLLFTLPSQGKDSEDVCGSVAS